MMEKTKITISSLLEDMKQGLVRSEIQKKYSLSGKEISDIFKHPALKGKKASKSASYILVDDTLVGDTNGEATVENDAPQSPGPVEEREEVSVSSTVFEDLPN